MVLGDPNLFGSSRLGFLFLTRFPVQTHQSLVGRPYKCEYEMHVIYCHYSWWGCNIRCRRHMDLASPYPRTVPAATESK